MKLPILFVALIALASPAAAGSGISFTPIKYPFPSEIGFRIIGAKGEIDGVASEYDWLRQYRPGWILLRQSTRNSAGNTFDMMEIRKHNERQMICFDISAFFGKY